MYDCLFFLCHLNNGLRCIGNAPTLRPLFVMRIDDCCPNA
jgi:hypothetical protein